MGDTLKSTSTKMSFAIKSIAIVLTYTAFAIVSPFLTLGQDFQTIFWPPSGIALAVVLLGGSRYLPAIFFGAALSGFLIDAPLIFILTSAIGSVLESFIALLLLNRYCNMDFKFNHIKDLGCLIIFGAFVPCLAGATLETFGLLVDGSWSNKNFLVDTIARWQPRVLGVLFFTPLILLFSSKRRFFPSGSSSMQLEITLLWLVAIAVGQMVFLDWQIDPSNPIGIAWVSPIIIWSGLRAGRKNTALIQLLFFSQALASVHLGIGVFADGFYHYGLLNFWMLALLFATVGLGIAITSTAQRYAIQQSNLNAKVFEVSHDGIMILDTNNNIVSVNPAFTSITGYTAEDVVGKNHRILSSGRHNSDFLLNQENSLKESGTWVGEIWNRHKNGSLHLLDMTIKAISDTNNKVFAYVRIFSDITQVKAEQDSILHKAHHDFLTGLPNRLLFGDRFNQYAAFANRRKSKFALIYLDLDKFKPVNDTFGHSIGDQLLVAVAQRLKSLVRGVDTVSRFGGDEFALLVSEVSSIEDVTALADKILAQLGKVFILEDKTIHISGSLGIALYPDHGTSMDELIESADSAMYQAKRTGRNTHVTYGQ